MGVVATVVQGGLIGPLVKRFGEQRLTLLAWAWCWWVAYDSAGPGGRSQSVVFPAVALLAFGTGLVTPSLRSLVSRRLSSGGQGAALGSLQGLQSLGSFLGPPLMGFSYELLGHSSPFLLAAAFLIGVAALSANGSFKQAG